MKKASMMLASKINVVQIQTTSGFCDDVCADNDGGGAIDSRHRPTDKVAGDHILALGRSACAVYPMNLYKYNNYLELQEVADHSIGDG